MRLLGLVLQNKKGQPLIISSSSGVSTRSMILYSHIIYENILENYRIRNKIQRTMTLQHNLLCVCNISKEYICYLFVRKGDLALAFDGIRKITQYFTVNKNSTHNRLENINRKIVQYMSIMQQFLYTRELPSPNKQLFIQMNAPVSSKKKNIHFEIFNKFSHLTNESDRRNILQTQMLSTHVQGNEINKKCKMLQQNTKFYIKNDQQLQDLLQTDPEKQNFIKNYRKSIIKIGIEIGGRKKKQRFNSFALTSFALSTGTNSNNNNINHLASSTTLNNFQSTIKSTLTQQQLMGNTIEQFKIKNTETEKQFKLKPLKLKFLQKLQLILNNGKVKEVMQFGQLLIDSCSYQNENQTYIVKFDSQLWFNTKILNKRVSPNSISIDKIDQTMITFKANSVKNKPIIDFVLKKQTFTPQKIPLLFIYTMQVSSNNIEFVFKYKINQKFTKKLTDIDVSVYLHNQFIPMDCKTIPSAHSLKNNKVTWKTKEISLSNPSKAKGKIVLAFGTSNLPPKKIIKQIKLSMKCANELIEGLDISVDICENNLLEKKKFNFKKYSDPQKNMIIQYKIAPNDSI